VHAVFRWMPAVRSTKAMRQVRICSLIGAPGVGKGTFAKIICSKMNWKHISLGYRTIFYAALYFSKAALIPSIYYLFYLF
jgi:ABC-type branched-subunit amino acid transport system ATPase component